MRDDCSGIEGERGRGVALSTDSRDMDDGGIFHFLIVVCCAAWMAVSLDFEVENGAVSDVRHRLGSVRSVKYHVLMVYFTINNEI